MDSSDPLAMLEGMLKPWHASLADPAAAQETVLSGLLPRYARTRYGREHNAGRVNDVQSFRANFPVVTYDEIKPS
ncbi:MAG: GH3 auxin-responsive promoter family protein, partial [Anaerolineales bacterium]